MRHANAAFIRAAHIRARLLPGTLRQAVPRAWTRTPSRSALDQTQPAALHTPATTTPSLRPLRRRPSSAQSTTPPPSPSRSATLPPVAGAPLVPSSARPQAYRALTPNLAIVHPSAPPRFPVAKLFYHQPHGLHDPADDTIPRPIAPSPMLLPRALPEYLQHLTATGAHLETLILLADPVLRQPGDTARLSCQVARCDAGRVASAL